MAGGSIWPHAAAQLNLPPVEVLLELSPFLVCGIPVLVVRPGTAAPLQVFLVVADDVLVEHGDVAARGLQIQMPEQGGSDMDRQPIIHQICREQSPEIMRRETGSAEARMALGEFLAASPQHVHHSGRGDDLQVRSDLALEQERHRRAGLALVRVVARQQWDGLTILRVAADDRGDDAEQFGGHGDYAFPIAFRGCDHEQGYDLPVGTLVLPNAEVGELKRLFDSDPGVAEDFHNCPLEERGILSGSDVDVLRGGLVENAHVCLPAETDPPFVGPAPQTLIGTAVDGERFPAARGGCVLKQSAQVLVPGLHVFHESAQQRLALAGSVVHPFLDAPFADPETADFRIGYRAGRDPDCPLLGLGGSPGLQVGVEGPDGAEDRLELTAAPAVGPDRGLLTPPPVEFAVDTQVRLPGGEFLDR
jgi:hypothetical protein